MQCYHIIYRPAYDRTEELLGIMVVFTFIVASSNTMAGKLLSTFQQASASLCVWRGKKIKISIIEQLTCCFMTNLFSINYTQAIGLGKYVNDCAPQHANSKMRMIVHNKVPYLCLLACIEGIAAGVELR